MTQVQFETKVLNIANRFLQEGEKAEFSYGSLFLTCAEKTSRKIFSDLFMEFDGKIKISKTPAEYAIDFVA